MKIVTQDNFDRDLFFEEVLAENVNKFIGKQLVEEWNNKYWSSESDYYLKLVDDDYNLYNGYDDFM